MESEIPDNIAFTSAKKSDIKLNSQGFEGRKVKCTLHCSAVPTYDETSAKN